MTGTYYRIPRHDPRSARRLIRRAALTPPSLARRQMPSRRTPAVTITEDGTRIFADLATPFGLGLYRCGFRDPEAEILRSALRPGQTFVDGGAHIGIFTLLAAEAVGPGGHVVSCEPVDETMELLQRNVSLNGLKNVELHKVALDQRSGRRELVSFGAASAFSSFAPATNHGSVITVVEAMSLDDLIGARRNDIRLIKLDIEGAEVRALRGARQVLEALPDFLIEVDQAHLSRQDSSVVELHDIFSAKGYEGYWIRDRTRWVELMPAFAWERPPVGVTANLFLSTRPLQTVFAPG